jgi:ATP/maltotriose-dependent transcriptional regulator MalT
VAHHAVSVLAAPLGAGKSAAVEQALSGHPGFTSLDVAPWHRGSTVAALVAHVRAVHDGCGRLTLAALATGVAPEQLGALFADELRRVRAPLLLVIDNAQRAYDDEPFARFMAAALERVPATARFLFVGRSEPPEELARAFARQRAVTLGYDALRFDAGEIDALARTLGRELGSAEIAHIAAATDGWAAGIVLTLAGAPAKPVALDSIAAAAAYLEAALLPTLSPAAVTFLETTAVLETLDLAALEAAGFPAARTLVTSLQRDGALLSATDVPGRFRVHPILRELALARLVARGGESAAHAVAVEVSLAAQALPAALYHVLAAGDAQVAGGFLRRHAVAALATGERERVGAVAGLLAPDGPDADVLALVRGLEEKAQGASTARATFERAARAALRSGDAGIGFLARAQIVEHDLGRLVRVDPAIIADLDHTAPTLGPSAVATSAMLGGWRDAIGFAFEAARDRVAPFARAADPAVRFNVGILHAYACTALGEFDDAAHTLDTLLSLLEETDRVVLHVLTLVWFARLALAWGLTTAADDAAAQAERVARTLQLRAEEAALYGVLTELAAHRGDARAIIEHAERARSRARDAWYVADAARLHSSTQLALARAAFLNHDNAIARQLAEHAATDPNIPGPTRALALTEAAIYTLLSNPVGAPDALAAARDAVRGASALDVDDAVALATAGDLLRFLARANGQTIDDVQPPAGPFDDLVARRAGLVTLELAGIAVGNARRGAGSADALAAAFDGLTRHGPRFDVRLARAYAARFVTQPRKRAAPAADFELTAREREILTFLVLGLTNKEIASRLLVGARTVETHVERVLGKLGVGSRSRAIAKALRIGLVDLSALDDDP